MVVLSGRRRFPAVAPFQSITQLQRKGSSSLNVGMAAGSDHLSSDSTFGGLVALMKSDSGSSQEWSTAWNLLRRFRTGQMNSFSTF
ncbi:hypothetical protein OIU74_015093 [Salix koriyanagi]|uniref:Uncharacterized protein n=1 Tax=Salix koriyanagi TaxID=2511006 RepID=A0A9Q0SZT5_9ROSI|nr:hypothetical protein OIU74_015093 [Salix koriyanagi]